MTENTKRQPSVESKMNILSSSLCQPAVRMVVLRTEDIEDDDGLRSVKTEIFHVVALRSDIATTQYRRTGSEGWTEPKQPHIFTVALYFTDGLFEEYPGSDDVDEIHTFSLVACPWPQEDDREYLDSHIKEQEEYAREYFKRLRPDG